MWIYVTADGLAAFRTVRTVLGDKNVRLGFSKRYKDRVDEKHSKYLVCEFALPETDLTEFERR